jgi:signal transduction histidine kinase
VTGISVRIKVFLLFAVAILVTVVPALVLISQAVEKRVYERATEELITANEALRAYWLIQDETLLQTARGVALEPGVAEGLRTSDAAMLRRALRREVGQNLVVIAMDTSGTSIVGPTLDSAAVNLGSTEVTLVSFPDASEAPLRLAFWPVVSDSGPAGLVGVGSRLDPATIRALKGVTGGSEIALVYGDSVLATTLPDSLVRVMDTMDLPLVVERGGIWSRPVEQYLYFASSLPTRGTPAAVILLRQVGEELRLAQGIQQYMVGVGAPALLLALLLSLLVARIVARPAQALASAASELARGNFAAPLPPPSGDEVGQLTRAFGEMRSSIAEREVRLRSAQAELIHREKLAAMGRLVAQLSHEINNPIYNIQNCLEVLDRRGDPLDPNREFLTLAREELQRMAVLTGQLLDQSRPLSDAATSLDMNMLVQRVVTLAAHDLRSNSVEFDLDLEPGLPHVIAHPDAIQQVLANLVANAMDAMPNGGRLRIRTRSETDAVETVVEDTGLGIPDEHLPHIFEAFYTTKPGIRGVGLGLFVSEGIVRGHRGQLRVDSSADTGTRFVVRLPRETLNSALAIPEPFELEKKHVASR